MYMDAQTVKLWLERVAAWRGPGTDTNTLDELRAFLLELHDQLVRWGEPTVAMREIPNVGQLLGRLCCNRNLMLQEADFQLVLQCILALYTSQPHNPLEEKASRWAQSQIRHSVSYYKAINPCCGVGESVGCSASQYNDRASLKLLESMVEDLLQVPSTKWDFGAKCLVPSTQLSSATLRDLAEFCLPLVTGCVAVAPLVECLLSCHGNDTEVSMSQAFLEAVVATQQQAYTGQCCSLELSFEGRLALWTRCLPALESEFLLLVKALMALSPWSEPEARQLISSRGLPKACAENPPLLTAVQTLMELLLQETEGSSFAVTLLDTFSSCVKESQSTLTVSRNCHHTSVEIESLHALLQADPRGLSSGLLTLYMKNISNCLMQIAVSDTVQRYQAWLVLVQSQVWYPVVIRTLLLGSVDNVTACLNILAWYNMPLVPSEHQQYKAQLADLVTSLRDLCSKSSPQSHDLLYAFRRLHGQDVHSSHLRNVITPLLMLFLVYGIGANQVLPDIVRLSSGGDGQPDAVTTFTFPLMSLEFALRCEQHIVEEKSMLQQKCLARTLQLWKVAYDRCRRSQQSAGSVTVPETLNSNLLRRYDRILKLVS